MKDAPPWRVQCQAVFFLTRQLEKKRMFETGGDVWLGLHTSTWCQCVSMWVSMYVNMGVNVCQYGRQYLSMWVSICVNMGVNMRKCAGQCMSMWVALLIHSRLFAVNTTRNGPQICWGSSACQNGPPSRTGRDLGDS